MTAKDNPASKLRLLECLFTEPSRQTESPSHIPTRLIYRIGNRDSPLQSLSHLKGGEDIKKSCNGHVIAVISVAFTAMLG